MKPGWVRLSMNCGIVHRGDTVSYELRDGTVVETIAQEDCVFIVPNDTVYATVNGYVKIDFKPKQGPKKAGTKERQ